MVVVLQATNIRAENPSLVKRNKLILPHYFPLCIFCKISMLPLKENDGSLPVLNGKANVAVFILISDVFMTSTQFDFLEYKAK